MKLIKPKFWEDKNILSYLMLPTTLITILINIIKKSFSKKRLRLRIRTICIGNIFIGGTGKTSLAIEINKILKKKFKTVFIKKKYLNQIDEINMLNKNGSVISTNERINSLKISDNKKIQVAILDDGLQQKNINYNLKIVCFNSHEGIGNGFLFPAGPLREKLDELKNYDLVFLNGEKKNMKLAKKIKSINKNLKIFEANYKPTNLNKLDRKKKYLMFCGIGNPHEFENTLNKYNFKINKKIIFPDHYPINLKEINTIKRIAKREQLKIITTEKDYYRLSYNQKKNIKYLKIKLNIKNLKKFREILLDINEKN